MKRDIKFLFLVIVIVMTILPVLAAPVLDGSLLEYVQTPDDTQVSGGISNVQWLAQNFTIGTVGANQEATLTGVGLLLNRTDAAQTGQLTISIYNVTGASMPDTLLASNSTFDDAIIGGSGSKSWVNVTFNESPTFSPSTQYWVVLSSTGDTGLTWRRTNSDVYSGGNRLLSSDSGSSWGGNAQDFLFEIYGSPLAGDVTLNHPLDTTETTNNTMQFNATVDGLGNNLVYNATLWVYNSSGIFNNTLTQVVNSNSTTEVLFDLTNINLGIYNWNVLAVINNSVGSVEEIFASSNFTFTKSAFQVNQEGFESSVFETDNQIFTLNITTVEDILSINPFLWYNGSKNNALSSCNSTGFCIINSTIDIPLVGGSGLSENKSFFWEVDVFDGTNQLSQNTSESMQNVSKIFLEFLNATHTIQTLNFTTWDETNRTMLSPMSFAATFDFWLGNGTVKKTKAYLNDSSASGIQLAISENRTFKADAFIEYNAVGSLNGSYNTRNYHFQGVSLTNTSQNIKLFLLDKGHSTSFIQRVLTTSQQPVVNALVWSLRYYPGTNEFETVQIYKTDENGETLGFFQTEIPDYKTIITQNGTVLKETDQGKILPESAPFTLTHIIGDTLVNPWTPFQNISGLSSSLIFNKTSNIVTYTYIDATGGLAYGQLEVYKVSPSGASTVSCNVSSSFQAGVLTCDLSNQSGSFVARTYISRSPAVIDQIITFTIEALSAAFGNSFLILYFLSLTAIIGLGLVNPPTGIVLLISWIFLSTLFGIAPLTWVFVWAIIAVAVWVFWEVAT